MFSYVFLQFSNFDSLFLAPCTLFSCSSHIYESYCIHELGAHKYPLLPPLPKVWYHCACFPTLSFIILSRSCMIDASLCVIFAMNIFSLSIDDMSILTCMSHYICALNRLNTRCFWQVDNGIIWSPELCMVLMNIPRNMCLHTRHINESHDIPPHLMGPVLMLQTFWWRSTLRKRWYIQ